MDLSTRTFFLRRPFLFVAAPAVFACASTLGLHAQNVNAPASDTGVSVQPKLNLSIPKLDLSDSAGYSSSLPQENNPVETAALDFKLLPEDATQPPPRRRYGRPRYNDSSHNPDGSNKYAFLAGVGLTQPVGNTYHYLTPSYSFQVGVGRNFNKNFATFFQFDYDNFGFNGRTLYNQSVVEDPTNIYGIRGQLDGNSHVWSFTLNPTYNIYAHQGLGAYVVAGGGFYHKVANFTIPVTESGYDYYGFYEQYTANEVIDHYTSNAVGVNGGFGLTFKPSRFANEKFYAEARYVFVANQQRPGFNINNYNSATTTSTNFYPANSNRTTYIPIKFGIRF